MSVVLIKPVLVFLLGVVNFIRYFQQGRLQVIPQDVWGFVSIGCFIKLALQAGVKLGFNVSPVEALNA